MALAELLLSNGWSVIKFGKENPESLLRWLSSNAL
jgi:hypothetical protein